MGEFLTLSKVTGNLWNLKMRKTSERYAENFGQFRQLCKRVLEVEMCLKRELGVEQLYDECYPKSQQIVAEVAGKLLIYIGSASHSSSVVVGENE